MGVKDGQLFFRDGWESFVSDCSISYGDFLVFFYDGDVGFDVKIYGISGCEKDDIIPVSMKKEVKIEAKSKDFIEQEVKIEVESEDSDEEMAAPNVGRKRKESPLEKKSNSKRINPTKNSECSVITFFFFFYN